MILQLVAVFIVLFVGVSVLVFASRIGMSVFDFRKEMRRSLSGSPENKSWNFVTSWLGLLGGPSPFIWGCRIVGIGFVAGAIFLLVGVLFSS